MPALPRVLIVDYDPRVLRSLSDLFTESGYQVETAKDGPSALAMFKETHPDAVLLEAMIPKKHGFEVCQEIKKSPEGKTTPVIIMTAVYKGRKYRTQAMHVHGCDEYVEKPCPPETILDIVRRMVPPGPVPQPVAAGRSIAQAVPDRLGEVIPFPSRSRGESTAFGEDEDAEREIMSKLDEILPDTPIFDERGFGNAMLAGSVPDSAIDYELVDPDSLSAENPQGAEVMPSDSFRSEGPGATTPRREGTQSPVIDAEFQSSEDPATEGQQLKRPPKALQADDVTKLTRARRPRPKAEGEEKKRRLIPRWMIVLLGLAVLSAVVTYVLNRM